MKLTRHEFQQLEEYWYERLTELGFNDIERKGGTSRSFFGHIPDLSEFERRNREEYYRFISIIVNNENTVFRNEVDRYILVRHAEGAKAVTISRELDKMGIDKMRRNRNSVRYIIRRYEMRWGIRQYTVKQLDGRKE